MKATQSARRSEPANPSTVARALHESFLDTSSKVALAEWDDVLGLQVDLFLPHELSVLQQFDPWRAARSVLDVGCGNGYYLSKLAPFFPEKSYTGLDISEELAGLARKFRTRPGLSFAAGDFFRLRPQQRVDLVLMRFLVQHLTDFDAILSRSRENLTPEGTLLIIEPELSRSANQPATPLFEELLKTFEEARVGQGTMRASLDAMADYGRSHPVWETVGDMRVSIPHVGPFAGSKVVAMYLRWVDLCQRSGLFAYDFDGAREEIHQWAGEPSSLSRIGLRFLAFQLRPERAP
jgi:ubiquinone/menaquinone biosynthesis C-methylase UbiE